MAGKAGEVPFLGSPSLPRGPSQCVCILSSETWSSLGQALLMRKIFVSRSNSCISHLRTLGLHSPGAANTDPFPSWPIFLCAKLSQRNSMSETWPRISTSTTPSLSWELREFLRKRAGQLTETRKLEMRERSKCFPHLMRGPRDRDQRGRPLLRD